ncbi:MAG: type II toxin-antitoxin system HipA family toxin [Acidobacteria bacterium]|nr:MAG: type II toxin-antitoxin system HipA family toxin [Acidobacteriota bacterium]
MTTHLVAFAEGLVMGTVTQSKGGRLTFLYSDQWLASSGAYPLSVSIPLAPGQQGQRKIEPFLWGLLPDNEIVLGQWARKFHVSPRNVFGLIANVGEDCAGAVQFVQPERLDAVRLGARPEVQWLDEAGVADRLRALRQDQSAWRMAGDTGQFSLGGAQPKTALLLENDRWGVPSGRLPTTHILKPPTGEFDGHAENEHFCLELARSFNLPVANSEIRRFEDQIAIVIERYDRVKTGGTIHRVHQEDVSQAMGLPPTKKYQSDGGPGVREIAELLTTFSTAPVEDIKTFVGAIAFNWLVAGTDAHAKNYALLLGSESRIRLAPLYDLASALPYPGMHPIGLKLAMKIGGEYGLRNIAARQWRKLAVEAHQNPEEVLANLRATAEAMPDRVLTVQQRVEREGLTHEILGRLSDRLIARAKECQHLLR